MSQVKVVFIGDVTSKEAVEVLATKLSKVVTKAKLQMAVGRCSSFEAATALLAWSTTPSDNTTTGGVSPRPPPPIPIYWQDSHALSSLLLLRKSRRPRSSTAKEEEDDDDDEKSDDIATITTAVTATDTTTAEETGDDDDDPSPCWKVGPNFYILRDKTDSIMPGDGASAGAHGGARAGIWSIPITGTHHALVVASLPARYRAVVSSCTSTSGVMTTTTTTKSTEPTWSFEKCTNHPSYVGCDILLSTEWPQGIETVPAIRAAAAVTTTQHKMDVSQHLVSYDVGLAALHARAQYHIAHGGGGGTTTTTTMFCQTPAFSHTTSIASTSKQLAHSGRFVALPPVACPISSKWLHAVAITPLHAIVSGPHRPAGGRGGEAMTTPLLPCPYLSMVEATTTTTTTTRRPNDPSATHNKKHNNSLDEITARRLIAEDADRRRIFGSNNKRHNNNSTTTTIATTTSSPVDPTNTTLFVYGLHQDVSGRLQRDDSAMLQAWSGALTVRRHHNNAYGFVTFRTHEAAAAYLGEQVVLGVRLQCRWADTNTTLEQQQQQQKKRQRTSAEVDINSTVLYFKVVDEHHPSAAAHHDRSGVDNNNNNSSSSSNRTLSTMDQVGETLRLWMEQVLEDELGGDIKAADEPAIRVQLRTPTITTSTIPTSTTTLAAAATTVPNFGFLDFASHAAASMVLVTLTGSTDGGRLVDAKRNTKAALGNRGIYLHWGRPPSSETNNKHNESSKEEGNIVQSGEGEFRFERKHYPADSRTDCWFCLASPACEKHLIVGVFDSCYAAQPKGPCHPGHVLLVPVQHDSSGALTNANVAREMDDLKRRLQRHAAAEYNTDLFIFERAIQTKGGYHTHVQCIPVPKGTGPKIRATLLAQANRQKFDLREISSDVPMHTIVDGDDGYFFAEIMTAKTSERYLCSTTATAKAGPPRVPLQFGREVLAAVLEQPDLAHWKSCVLDESKEAEAAAEFRKSFAQYVDSD